MNNNYDNYHAVTTLVSKTAIIIIKSIKSVILSKPVMFKQKLCRRQVLDFDLRLLTTTRRQTSYYHSINPVSFKKAVVRDHIT